MTSATSGAGLYRSTSSRGGGYFNVVGICLAAAGLLLAMPARSGIRDSSSDEPRLEPNFRETGGITRVAFSPDGAILATAGPDGTVRLWNPRTSGLLHTLSGHTGGIWTLTFSPNGDRLASTSFDGSTRIWDVRSGLAAATLRHGEGGPMVAAFSPDGSLLATAGGQLHAGDLCLWELNPLRLRAMLGPQSDKVLAVAFSPDGRLLASGGRDDNAARLWDTATGQQLQILRDRPWPVGSLIFSPDGKFLLTGRAEEVEEWQLDPPQVTQVFKKAHVPLPFVPELSSDGKLLSLPQADGGVRIVDRTWPSGGTLVSGKPRPNAWVNTVGLAMAQKAGVFVHSVLKMDLQPMAEPHQGSAALYSLTTGKKLVATKLPIPPGLTAITPDGKCVTVASWEGGKGEAVVWMPGHSLRTLPVNVSRVERCELSADGRLVAASYSDGRVRVWEAQTGWLRFTRMGVIPGRALEFSPTGRLLAAEGTKPGSTTVWETSSGRLVSDIPGLSAGPSEYQWPQGEGALIIEARDAPTQLWGLPSGKLRARIPDSQCDGPTLSPDGSELAGVGKDGAVRIWSCASGKLLRKLSGHASSRFDPVFSPNGALLCSGEDGTKRIWNLRSGECLQTIKTDGAQVGFSPNCEILGLTESKRLRLWRTSDWQPIALPKSEFHVRQAAFSTDGAIIAAAGDRLRLWRVERDTFSLYADCPLPDKAFLDQFEFSHDGRSLALREWGSSLRVWNTTTGVELPQPSRSDLLGFSIGVRAPYSYGGDRVWLNDPITGNGLLTMQTLPRSPALVKTAGGEEWISFTPESWFVASAGAKRLFHWNVGGTFYPAERFWSERNRPDKVAARLLGLGMGAANGGLPTTPLRGPFCR